MMQLAELIAAANAGNAVADRSLRLLICEYIDRGKEREMPESLLVYYRKAMLSDPLDRVDGTKTPRVKAPLALQ